MSADIQLQRSLIGTALFILSSLIVGGSITFPTMVLFRAWRERNEDKIQFGVIIATWLAPILSLASTACSCMTALYVFIGIIFVMIVIANIAIFVKYRPSMNQWEWFYIGIILALILEQAVVLIWGPSSPIASILSPFYQSS